MLSGTHFSKQMRTLSSSTERCLAISIIIVPLQEGTNQIIPIAPRYHASSPNLKNLSASCIALQNYGFAVASTDQQETSIRPTTLQA